MQALDPAIGVIVYNGVLWDGVRGHPKQAAGFDKMICFYRLQLAQGHPSPQSVMAGFEYNRPVLPQPFRTPDRYQPKKPSHPHVTVPTLQIDCPAVAPA